MRSGAQRSDVAQKAGVSGSTVSRALSDSPLITAAIKQRVCAVAKELGYIPNRQAAGFVQNKTMHMGLVIPYYKSFPPFSRPYFPTVLDGAVLGAKQRGYYITLILDRAGPAEQDIVTLVRSRVVDGLLLAVTASHDKHISELKSRNIPFVLINNHEPDCFCVDGKPEPGMRMAFQHAKVNGHSMIGYITGDLQYQNAIDRLTVFKKLTGEFHMRCKIVEGNFSRMNGYRCAGSLLSVKSPPTCIMTAADRQAFGVLDYCREHSIGVPEEVSVIGFDNFDPAPDMTPSLTTVDNPVIAAARTASGMLADILEGKLQRPTTRWLDTGFVSRQSSGVCRKK